MQVGYQLKNGATIVAAFQHGDDPNCVRVVLCTWPRNALREFVTWRCDNKGNAFWGNYHRTLDAALDDFLLRCKKEVPGLIEQATEVSRR